MAGTSPGGSGGPSGAGNRVEKIQFESDQGLNSLWLGSDGSLWVGGNELRYYTGKTWEKSAAAEVVTIRDLWGAADRPSVLSGNGNVFFLTADAWQEVTAIDACVYPVALSVTDKFVYGACSYYSGMVRIDRSSRETETALGADFATSAVWAFADNDVFALQVGAVQAVSHYTGGVWDDGANWPTETLPDVGFNRLTAMCSPKGNELLIVGERGTIIRRREGKWNREDSGTEANLSSVWGSKEYGTYAVGDEGTILFHDGNTWTKLVSPTTETLNAVRGRVGAGVAAVGESGTVLRIRE